MVAIRNLVAIQGCKANRNPDCNPGQNLHSRTGVANRVVIKVAIRNLVAIQGYDSGSESIHNPNRNPVRNPETFWN